MKRKIIYLLSLCMALALPSCSLDEEPYGFYSEDNFYKTAEDAQAAIHYAYAALTYIEYSRSIFFLGDMPTEMLTTKSDASTDNQALNLWRISNFDTNGTLMNFFKYSYIGINRANAVIKKVPGGDYDQQLKDQYVGEAHFLRAYNYFSLVRNFGLVPLHENVVETLDQTSTPLPDKIDEIFDLIIADCRKAESLLPVYDAPRMGRIDRVAAQALLAKVYLYAASAKAHQVPLYRDMREDVHTLYQHAAEYAGKVVDDQSVYGFEENLLDIYDIDKPGGREHIFLMAMDRTGESEGQYSKISKMFLPYVDGATLYLKQGDTETYIPSHDGWGEYRTEMVFYKSFDVNDKRRSYLIVDKVYSEDGSLKGEWKEDGSGNIPYPFSRKYIDPKFDGDKTSTRPYLIRFSDIALVYAEAAGPTARSYELVNFIRRRAGLGDLAPNLSIDDFREQIFQERTWEMAYEGDHMYDIRRWNRTGQIQEVRDAGLSEAQYTFYPLPQAEINLNSSLR